MATTPKGIYYPNNYNEIADIPEDMKKMAESIDGVFEDTDSDLSDIKAEQTTQNNRLNSLEVDNTTNKSDILTNKQEINNIKTEQTTQNNRLSNLETDNTTNKNNISANTQEINNIKQEQTEQNTNISTNATNIETLQSENENLKKIVSQLPQVEGQGTSITLENTIEAQFTKFDEEGNSTQETTEGRNLFSKNEVSQTNNGITTNITNYNVFTINGTSSSGANWYSLDRTNTKIPAGTYTFSLYYDSGTNSNPGSFLTFLRPRGGSSNLCSLISPSSSNLIRSATFTVEQETDIDIYGYCAAGITLTNFVMKLQLEEGSTAHDYEPFTNGASPNPNYEQPIKSAGDNENIWNGEIERGAINGDGLDVDAINRVRNVGYYELNKGTYTLSYKGAEQSVVYIFNANKVKVNNPSWENGKSTFTLEENGYIKYALKQLDNREMNVNDVSNIKLEKGNKASGYSPYGMGSINEKIQNKNVFNKNTITEGKYIDNNGNFANDSSNFVGDFIKLLSINSNLSYRISATTGKAKRIGYYDNSKTFISRQLISTTQGKLNIPENASYVRLSCYNDELESLQLEIIEDGSTATPYVPHEEQDYSIFVQQPFRSNKDKTIKDKFVIKSDNKKYERHWIGEVVLNGTEYWELLNSTSDYYEFITYNSLKPVAPSSYTFPMASHFGNATNNRCVANGNQLLIRVPASMNITNATEFKTWLQENNVTINYLLVEPLDLPCTEEQIQQLENKPSTYKDFTIIQSQDETPAYLEVSGIYDLNKLISRVEVIESEV